MIIKKLLGHKTLLFLVILYTGIITWASVARLVLPIKFEVEGSDKVGHLIAYFIFTIVWFLFLFFSKRSNESFVRSLIKAAIICFLYGLLMEISQAMLTSYRSAEWYDVLANTSGIIFAAICIKAIENKLVSFRRRKSQTN